MIEMLDQVSRTKSGGEMLKCFKFVSQTHNVQCARYIKMRIGEDLLTPSENLDIPFTRKITLDKISHKLLQLYLKILRFCVPKGLRDEVFISTSLGERHKWMYDRFSLTKLLHEVGFSNVQVCDYQTSQIKDFALYCLDINSDKTPYKGISSLYMECQKP